MKRKEGKENGDMGKMEGEKAREKRSYAHHIINHSFGLSVGLRLVL